MNNKEYAGNIGLPAMAGTVVNSTFVHLINFSACGQVSASKPPLRQAPKSYGQCYWRPYNLQPTDIKPTVKQNQQHEHFRQF
jgi:hypothetical protein